MAVFTQKPPPPAAAYSDKTDPSKGVAEIANNQTLVIRSIEDTQNVVEGIYNFLDNFIPTRVTDTSTGIQYLVLAQQNGAVPVIPPDSGLPYEGGDASVATDPIVKIRYGTHNDFVPDCSGVPLTAIWEDNLLILSSGDTIVYVEVDYDYDTSGTITISSASIASTSGTRPDSTITPAGDGSGSGTLYQTLFAVAVTFDDSGNAIVTVSPNVGGSQGFGICQGTGASEGTDTTDSVSGPWGV